MRSYLRAANVSWEGLSLEDVKEMDFSPAELKSYRLAPGDILLAEASGSASEVGKPAMWRGELPLCCFQNTLIRVRAPAEVAPFLLRRFSFDARSGAFASASKGVGIHHLSAGTMLTWQVDLPPLQEQQRLSAALDSYLSRLDAAEAALRRVQANLKRYRASVLKAAVEGRLVETEAELARREGREYEPASELLKRILTERRRRWEQAELAKMKAAGKVPKDDRWKEKYQEPAAPETEKLPELPEGWCWATVAQLAVATSEAICAGPFGTIFKARDFRETGIPIVFLRHVKPGLYRTTKPTFMLQERWQELFQPYSVFGGEILVTKLGDPPGDAAIYPAHLGPAMLTPDVMKLEVEAQLAASRYVMHYLNSIVAKRRAFGVAFGTTRLRLTLPLFRQMAVPLPPKTEQARLAGELDSALSESEATSASVEAQLARLSRLRQSILKWAFEGKLVDQDPDDEPAEVLLARIRAERGVVANPSIRRKPKARHPAAGGGRGRQTSRARKPDAEQGPV